ncbi:hypothetical protein DPM33_15150 [Mesorhizobium hawassense]|uniref:Uncharacterized protein n=1 Tax=Mesorhizobium hawassense TaxID=1209954 RepID=A0A330HPT5_9HYPH|nr:hypothetical protein [Mesorhizobium hawassense]RAZ90163.1 hypothetical protein DPM33_15150 [Mesorhizobium hawassense]
MMSTNQKPDLPMVDGKILVELFDLRKRCLAMGFTDADIAASMREAPWWFPSLAERENAA